MELTGRNISFKYSSGSRQILKDVDITIDNKKILGLFGDSGSGNGINISAIFLNGKNLLSRVESLEL